MTRTRAWLLSGMTIVVLIFQMDAAQAAASLTTRVSVSITGAQADGVSNGGMISGDGRFVAFASTAANLVTGDMNGVKDVFVRDRQTGTTIRVSVGAGATEANGASDVLAISADGNVVAFSSSAGNLVPNDVNAQDDVFTRNLQTATTTLVSVDSNGVQGNGPSPGPGSLSADGHIVSFISHATNLVVPDTNFSQDLFVHDVLTGTTELASVDSSGGHANDGSNGGSLSADGRFVAFVSFASNLVAGDTNNKTDVFVHDRTTGATTRENVSSLGAQANGSSNSTTITPDGRLLVFDSFATTLVTPDTNGGFSDVFVRDLQADTTTLASVDSAGTQRSGDSGAPVVSAGGRFVVFSSNADLVTGDTNGVTDVFIHDRATGTTDRASVDGSGNEGNGQSVGPFVDGAGRFVAFYSLATNLVVGDTNNNSDIFVRDRGLCGGAVVSVQGTAGNDTLTGTAGPDVIAGLGGNDTINGLDGNDKLCGGSGNDNLNGGNGKDRLIGAAGDDAMNGGNGSDKCEGGTGTGDTAANCEVVTGVP